MDLELDNVTRSLFAQLRRDRAGIEEETSSDFDILICPKCSDRLEPLVMPVEVDPKTNYKSQSIWWTCRGLNTKTCIFPLNMPAKVFWTRRTASQMRDGLLPLPNIHLLPPQLHYLYPAYFDSAVCSTSGMKPSSTDHAKNNSVTSQQEQKQPIVETAKKDSTALPAQLQSKDSQRLEVRYGSADSRRHVELFADSNAALNSMIALKYRTESFLNSINSEMSRKQLVKPTPAISSQQRRRLSYLMQRYRTKHGGAAPPLNVVEAMHKKITTDANVASPASSLRSVLSIVNVPTEVVPEAMAQLLAEEPDMDEEPIMSPPPTDPYNAKGENQQPAEIEAMVTCQPSTSTTLAVAGTSQFSTAATATSERTSAGDISLSSKKSAKLTKSVKKKLTPMCSFDDPEIDSVLKRNFEELRKAMFGVKRRKRKTKDTNLTTQPADRRGQMTPVKRSKIVGNNNISEKNCHLRGKADGHGEEDDEFAALQNYSYTNDESFVNDTGYSTKVPPMMTDVVSPINNLTSHYTATDEFGDEGDSALRYALLSHFNVDEHADDMLVGLEDV